jgi:hypothetical protein
MLSRQGSSPISLKFWLSTTRDISRCRRLEKQRNKPCGCTEGWPRSVSWVKLRPHRSDPYAIIDNAGPMTVSKTSLEPPISRHFKVRDKKRNKGVSHSVADGQLSSSNAGKGCGRSCDNRRYVDGATSESSLRRDNFLTRWAYESKPPQSLSSNAP